MLSSTITQHQEYTLHTFTHNIKPQCTNEQCLSALKAVVILKYCQFLSTHKLLSYLALVASGMEPQCKLLISYTADVQQLKSAFCNARKQPGTVPEIHHHILHYMHTTHNTSYIPHCKRIPNMLSAMEWSTNITRHLFAINNGQLQT